MDNPGTEAAPWSTLEAVFSSGKTFAAGDIILLRSGYHGYARISGHHADHVTIQPDAGHHPRLRKIRFENASYWTIRGLDVCPLYAGETSYDTGKIIEAMASTHHITIEDCWIRSVFSVDGWTEDDWRTKVGGAIQMRGPHVTITGNRIENVSGGIFLLTAAEHSTVSYNVIDTLRDDGLRGLASYCRFEYNTVKNMYNITSNHDDGFQSYSVAADGRIGQSVVYNVELRGNIFISYTDPQQPFKANMQGIGCFDGMFEGWVIENNVVITDRWHGISLYGAVNCRIINNTVVENPLEGNTEVAWIHINDHKDGRPSTGNIVRNNIAPTMKVSSARALVEANLATRDYAAVFADWNNFDLHLRADSPAIGLGVTGYAPLIDADQEPRTLPIDLGAYDHEGLAASEPPPAPVEQLPLEPVQEATFSVSSGTYPAPQTVALSTTTEDASIHYTTDGSVPSETHGTPYTGPIDVLASTTVQAVAFKTGHPCSAVTSATYTILPPVGESIDFETDALPRTSGDVVVSVKKEGGASGGVMMYVKPARLGGYVEFTTGTIKAGTYRLEIRAKRGGDRGQHSVIVDGQPIEAGVDHYNKTHSYDMLVAGHVTFSRDGQHAVRITSSGKNSASSGYVLAPDRLSFIATSEVAAPTEPAPTPAPVPPVADPQFSLPGGTYTGAVTVSLSSATDGAWIRYTLDGSTPDESHGELYAGPIELTADTVLQAVAGRDGTPSSAVVSAGYTLLPPPGVSVSFETDELARTSGDVIISVKREGGSSGGTMMYVKPTRVGGYVELTTGLIQPGEYLVAVRAKRGGDRGQHALSIDGEEVAPEVDHYNKTHSYDQLIVGTVIFMKEGVHRVRLTVTGKNAASSGYVLAPDSLSFIAL